jgi:hypothetical protein
MLEQMRNLSNSFNPMARFSGISLVRGFGRNTSAPATPAKDKDTKDTKDATAKDAKDTKDSKDTLKPTDGGDLATVSSFSLLDSLSFECYS